jgi:hypothetical protein
MDSQIYSLAKMAVLAGILSWIMKYSWEYFWGIWKLCSAHSKLVNPHSFYDHLRLWEFDDQDVRRLGPDDIYE